MLSEKKINLIIKYRCIVCVMLLLGLSACNESIRNPSMVDDRAFLKALPANVIGEISLEYFGADQGSEFGSIYENGEQVLFVFGADGSLSSTEQEILIDDAYEIISQEFVWLDEKNDIKYSLSIDDSGVGKLKITSIDGTSFYGQFSIRVKGAETNGNSNSDTNTISGEGDSLLPSTATGQYRFTFTDAQDGFDFNLKVGDKYLLAFFSAGPLRADNEMSVIDDQFEVRGDEFVWVDPNNQLEYILFLTPQETVDRVEIYDFDENYYGTFELIERVLAN